ncbi:MAG: hypothetical protein ILP09_06895, partial [Oscillospiraceae bacterium]|nr:hypothetical protein [Oscillospiraceae bacterium]
ADRGGAVLLLEEDCTPLKLYDTVRELCGDARRRSEMSAAMLSMARPDAVSAVIDEILDAVRQPRTH